MDNEDTFYNDAEQKHKVMSMEHKASFTVGTVDQVEGSEQACLSHHNTNERGPAALFSDQTNDSVKSVASETGAKTSSALNSFPKLETVDGEFEKPSSAVVRTKALDRRRTVSEGHCPDDSQTSDDSLRIPGLVRVESSPTRIEHKERSLEECKLILKQSVCCSDISCFLSIAKRQASACK